MKFSQQYQGKAFDVVALVLANGGCPATEYLANLQAKDPGAYQSMLRVIEHRADNLEMRSSKPLRGKNYQGLFRLTQGGERLCYMYLPGEHVIVLLNGYCKTDVEKAEYERARHYRIDLLNQIK